MADLAYYVIQLNHQRQYFSYVVKNRDGLDIELAGYLATGWPALEPKQAPDIQQRSSALYLVKVLCALLDVQPS